MSDHTAAYLLLRYSRVRRDVDRGEVDVDELDDLQYAGLWVYVFGEDRALSVFDGCSQLAREEYLLARPTLRRLLVGACGQDAMSDADLAMCTEASHERR